MHQKNASKESCWVPLTWFEHAQDMPRTHEDSYGFLKTALVGKWLHIWNVCSAICSRKMTVSWWVLVRFWVFKNPYESSCVLPCPGHVLGMFKSCQRLPATRFWCIFFQFFSIFFSTLFAKNQLCYVEFVNSSPCSELSKRHQRLALHEILTLLFMTEIWHKNVSPDTPETPISGL